MRRLSARGLVCFALTATMVASISCGGSDSGGTGPTPEPVVVTIAPAQDTLTVSTAAAFSATVIGTSNTGVSWSVQEGAPGGTVSGTGLFTASGTPGTRHIIAVSQENASSKDTAVVLVVAAPVAAITAPAAVGTGAAGLGASVPAQSGATYAWTITGGTITSGAATATVTFSAGALGTLTLQCTVTNLAGTSATSSKAIAVQSIPAITSFTASKDTVTNGESVSLTAVYLGGTGMLSPGAVPISSGVPVVVGPITGTVTYTLTVTGAVGPTVSSTLPIRGVIAPVIGRFNVLQRALAAGDVAYLQETYGQLGGEVSGTINPGVGPVPFDGVVPSLPLMATTTFTLTVTNLADSAVSDTARVLVEPPVSGTFSAAGILGASRSEFTATLLTNGKVLVAGGSDLASAELWDPVTRTFSPTGSMAIGRSHHAAIRLGDGRVLVTGGNGASAEIYDPLTGQFSAAGAMVAPRARHTMTLLPDGKVLIVGGAEFPYRGVAELYDPATQSFALTDTLADPSRIEFEAVGLLDGRVLIILGRGDFGQALATAETYNPASGTFSVVGSMAENHEGGTATRLASGQVVVIGGLGGPYDENGPHAGLNPIAELFSPATNQFSSTGAMAFPRLAHFATLRSDGTVLVSFGMHPLIATTNMPAEVYDPAGGAFHPGARGGVPRSSVFDNEAILVSPGIVLILGGAATAEIFQ